MSSNLFHRVAAAVATLALGAAACGGESSAGEKFGGAASPVTLRLGTVEDEAAPYADEVEQFADAVETLSDGSIDVEFAWEASGPFTGESERKLAAMAQGGEIDLAIVATRAWDQLDVTSMQALQAPFLVDNLGLLNEIAESDLAAEMLAGLDDVGVTGLAMWPESLRHPVGFDGPLLTAADFRGAQLRVPISDASYRLANAIGAEPVDPEDWDAAVTAGELDGAESAFVWALDLPRFGTFTANITFYPKVNTIVANTETFDSLPDKQQEVLRQAAAETLDYVIESNATEHDLALEYCAAGGSVAITEDSDLDELAELATPVLAELSQDADTARFIDEMRALKEGTATDPATSPAACEPEVDPDVIEPDTPADVFPEGVYRVETADGVFTNSFIDGVWEGYTESGELDCAGTYVVESGRIWMSNSTEPALACGNPPGFQFLDAAWTFADGELRFVDINSDPNAVRDFGGQPWTMIEGASDSDAESATFPEGIYRTESDLDGTVTMSYIDGVWKRFTANGEVDCAATYVVESGRIWLTTSGDPALDCGNPPGGVFLDAAWTLEGDQLRFIDINSDQGAVQEFGLPWTRIE